MDHLNQSIRYVLQNSSGLINATVISIEVAILSAILALVWGLILVIPRMSNKKIIQYPVRGYVELMRNSPLLVQMYLIYFGLPMFGITFSGFVCGMIAIASQHGAFLSEVYRAAIESIPSGQRHGGLAIGMRKWQVMVLIVVPQAISKIMPSIGNQLVLLVKDTSLMAGIGVMELTLTGKTIIERSGAAYEVFIAIAIIYLIMTAFVGFMIRIIENRRRWGY